MPVPGPRIATKAPVSTGTLVWRARGQLYVTIAAKAVFALVHERAMELVEPLPILTTELHFRNNPSRSVRATTEMVPYLARTDIVLTGHACAPEGEPAARVAVRLLVSRESILLDKKLEVLGDRDKQGERQPFDRIPLIYERALGGIGWEDNPMGAGCRPGAEPDTGAANILDPSHPERSVGFGPLSRMWPTRRRLLGSMTRKALDEPIVEIPDDFDWTYFHAAPVDQRVELLHGNEWVMVEGVHAVVPQIRSRLPDARVLGSVAGLVPGGAARAMQLSIDMLHVDADEQTCTVVWRGALPVRDEATIGALDVSLALEVEGQTIEWSEAPEPVAAPPTEELGAAPTAPASRPGEQPAEPQRKLERTVAWSPEDDEPPASKAPPVGESTVAWEEEAAPANPATPFAPKSRVERTHALSLDEQDRAAHTEAVPFAQQGPPGAPPARFQRAPVPGAPWAGGAPAPPAPQLRRRADDTITLDADLDDDAPPQRPAAIAFTAKPKAPPPSSPGTPQPAPPMPPSQGAAPSLGAAPPLIPPPAPSRPAPIPPPPPSRSAPMPPRPMPPRSPAARADLRPPVVQRASDVVPVVGASPFVTFTLPWQMKAGKDVLAVIVKATCDLVPDGRATLREQADPPSGDVHEGDDPMRTLRTPTDFVAFKPRADVVLTGHAYPPGGSSPAAQVRFRFGHRKNGFDRRIAVFGERRWTKAGVRLAPTAPRPFTKVPLVYERAFGGAGNERNPAGIGAGTDALPQLEDPAHLVNAPSDTPEPACFAAVPALWPARWSKLGTFNAAWKKSRWPFLPDDADLTFFQSAPAAQQLDHLTGDEPYELIGIHAEHPSVTGKLPGVKPRCFVQKTQDGGGDFHEVLLRLDTVSIDADTLTAQLVWRGMIDVRDDDASDVGELFVFEEPVSGAAADRAAALARYLEARGPAPEDALGARPQNDVLPSPERTPAEVAALRADVVSLLATGGSLASMDLIDADLEGLNFEGRSLEGALLLRARLRGANLRGADLSGAQLAGADLTSADLSGANITRADLTGADLTSAVFSGAVLADALFRRAQGEGARFDSATGAHASFEEGRWKRARFSQAQLPGADFSGATLDAAVFDGADLPDVRLYDAHGSAVSCKGAGLARARADGARFERSFFQDVKAPSSVWDRARLDGSTFQSATLTESGFARASCKQTIFSGADLSAGRLRRGLFPSASFLRANLLGASLEAANLEGADLRSANLHAAETHKARWRGARLDGAIVTQTKLAEKA
ncbi:MAG: DUF2169 domain-containing protein [Polyangiaceae bacterium]